MSRSHVMLAVALAVTLSACGGGEQTVSAEKPKAKPAAPKAAAPKAAAPKTDCLAVPADLLAGIASGEEQGVGGLTLTGGKAYKSPDFTSVFFIAATLTAPGVEGEKGVWASNKLEAGGGLTMAVDGIAKQFTVWPDADETEADISSADPGVGKAKGCLD